MNSSPAEVPGGLGVEWAAIQRLHAHRDVTAALASSTTPEEAGPRIVESLCEQLGWDFGALWRVDAASGVIRPVHVCRRTVCCAEFERATRRLTLPQGSGLPGRIWAVGEPLWVADVREDVQFIRAKDAAAAGVRAAVGYPLPAGEQVLGVIELLARETRLADPELMAVLASIGTQAGQFIERAEAEAALRAAVRESEARARAMLESALDCVVGIDHLGRVTEFNPAAEQTFGHPRERVIGTRMVELIVPPSLRAAHLAGVARHLADGETHVLGKRVEMRALRADGTEFPVEIAITRVPLPGPPEFTAYLRDISQRRRRDDELRQTEDLYRLVVENTHDLVSLLDVEGTIVYASPSHDEKLGRSGGTLEGTPFLDLVHPEDREPARNALASAQGATRTPFAGLRLRHRTGRWIVVEGTVCGIGSDQGRVTTLVNVSDQTEREQAEHDRKRREQAEREFVVNAAHELRTPLAAISAVVEVLEAGAKDVPEERDSFLADVRREVFRMQRLVRSLLVLARVQTLQEPILHEPIVLRQLLLECAEAIEPARGVEVEVLCPASLTVLADRALLETAISNLGTNAAAHTERGRIRLTGAADRDGAVQIAVSDTGSGMSPEDADRAFDRFYRASKRDGDGFGLGLAIVRQAAEAHDGAVGIETVPGAGTTVRITLPSGPVGR